LGEKKRKRGSGPGRADKLFFCQSAAHPPAEQMSKNLDPKKEKKRRGLGQDGGGKETGGGRFAWRNKEAKKKKKKKTIIFSALWEGVGSIALGAEKWDWESVEGGGGGEKRGGKVNFPLQRGRGGGGRSLKGGKKKGKGKTGGRIRWEAAFRKVW